MASYRATETLTEDGKIASRDLPFQSGQAVEVFLIRSSQDPDSTLEATIRQPGDLRGLLYGMNTEIAQERDRL